MRITSASSPLRKLRLPFLTPSGRATRHDFGEACATLKCLAGVTRRSKDLRTRSPRNSLRGFISVPVRQVHERGIGQLYSQIPIAGKNRSDSRQIHRIERGKLKGFAVKGGQESCDRDRVPSQKPRRLGDYRPAREQRAPDMSKLLDASFMVFVGCRKNGHDRARIHQYRATDG
jgi:hypothetical protein